METFIAGIFAAIIVGATAAFGYVVYVDHSGRTARKRRRNKRWRAGVRGARAGNHQEAGVGGSAIVMTVPATARTHEPRRGPRARVVSRT